MAASDPTRHPRLPLQVGTSSVASLAIGAVVLVPGLVLTILTAAIWFALDDALGDVGGYVGAIMFTGALALFLVAVAQLRRAWRARPSDVRLDSEGFTVDGGAHHGLRVRWVALPRGEGGCRVEKPDPKAESDDKNYRDIHRLVLRAVDVDVVLAIAEDEAEAATLADVAATLRAGAVSGRGEERRKRKRERKKAQKTATVDVVACPSCGAVVAPADAPTVKCAFCDAECPMPDDVRTRVRDSADIAQRPNRVIAKLLDQPSARSVTRLYAVAAIVQLVAWPTAIILFARAVDEEAASFLTALTLLVFVASTILGCYALVRGRLVDRVALRLVLVELAADAPVLPGEPFSCRACHAPLPSAGIERAVVTCAYCAAQNILVRDVHREANEAREERRSVEDALARRNRERERLRGIGIAAVLLLAVGGASLRYGFAENKVAAPYAKKCNSGDLDACIDLGELHLAGPKRGVKHDPKRARKLFERACDGGRARGCSDLGDFHANYGLLGYGGDPKRAAAYRERACAAGWAQACAALAEMYTKGDFLGHVPKDPKMAKHFSELACDGGAPGACKP